MGNCLTSKDLWFRVKFRPVKFGKASTSSSPAKLSKVASKVSNVVSVPATPIDVEDFRQMAGYGNLKIFTYNELMLATKNFRPDLILGEGGFGFVYKGQIDENIRPGFKSTEVAVKELNREGFQGDKEWLAELNYLGQFSHPNLVKLIGYCCEDEHRLLVYEYMAGGSLETHLFRRICALSWTIRIKIALDAAKGLAFLHGAERPIIYRDFKTSNILLDTEYNAKLSDFGLAKEGPVGDKTHVSTRVMGTYGYAAPEYVMTGHLTARSDVYTYGVVLLELLIGRRALDSSRPGREDNLVDWARPLLTRSSKLLKIIDPRMECQYSSRSVQLVAKLAYECINQNPKGRPTMSEVVEVLDNLLKNEEMQPQSSENVVTLYEVPKETSNNASVGNKYSERAHNRIDILDDGRRKIEPPDGSNRGELPKEYRGDILSPVSSGLQPERKSFRICGGSENSSMNVGNMYHP